MRSGPDHGQLQERLDFGEYLDGLYGYAMALSRNTAEAEDLVQETCLRALRAIDQLRTDGSAKSWLFTILRNIWLNLVRQRRTAPDLIELDADENSAYEPADAAQDPHSGYVNKVEREEVQAAIQQLPLEFREIIILREYEDLSYQEIAVLLIVRLVQSCRDWQERASNYGTYFPTDGWLRGRGKGRSPG